MDGYGPDFCKKFGAKISTFLTRMLTTADIVLINEKGKSPDRSSTYRPVSLINVDSKIPSKILAKPTENAIPELVKPDQTGEAN